MPDYTVIYDTVAWTTGSVKDNDLAYHSANRGDTLPADVPQEKIDQWLDPAQSPPHGAIAESGSRLAQLGASGASVAQDPREARRIFQEAAGADRGLLDPARDPVDQEKSSVDAGVARSRAAAGRGTGTADVAPAETSRGTGRLDIDSMSKAQLQTMADGLGVEYSDSDNKDELKAKIRAASGDSAPPEE